jgi:predicted DNA-binding transcriptional regulator AlpA
VSNDTFNFNSLVRELDEFVEHRSEFLSWKGEQEREEMRKAYAAAEREQRKQETLRNVTEVRRVLKSLSDLRKKPPKFSKQANDLARFAKSHCPAQSSQAKVKQDTKTETKRRFNALYERFQTEVKRQVRRTPDSGTRHEIRASYNQIEGKRAVMITRFLTRAEVAKRVGMSEGSLVYFSQKVSFPRSIRIDGRSFYLESEIAAWCRQHGIEEAHGG